MRGHESSSCCNAASMSQGNCWLGSEAVLKLGLKMMLVTPAACPCACSHLNPAVYLPSDIRVVNTTSLVASTDAAWKALQTRAQQRKRCTSGTCVGGVGTQVETKK